MDQQTFAYSDQSGGGRRKQQAIGSHAWFGISTADSCGARFPMFATIQGFLCFSNTTATVGVFFHAVHWSEATCSNRQSYSKSACRGQHACRILCSDRQTSARCAQREGGHHGQALGNPRQKPSIQTRLLKQTMFSWLVCLPWTIGPQHLSPFSLPWSLLFCILTPSFIPGCNRIAAAWLINDIYHEIPGFVV